MSTPEPRVEGDRVVHPRRWLALALLSTAQLMLILDVTVVAIALPRMGSDLGLSREALTWVVASYTVAFGGLLLLGGRTADILGPKAMLYAGLAVFTAGSLAAGLAWDDATVLGGRAAQGVGAAMLSPGALSSALRLFTGEERNRALGIWSAVGSAGSAGGVLLGGLIAAGPGWRWVFFINIPIAVVVVIGLLRILPALPPETGSRRRLDVPGAALAIAATGLAISSLITAGEIGWTAPRTLITGATAVVLYAAFGWWQRTTRSPLIDLGLLRRRSFSAGTFVLLIAVALTISVFFLGTFYFQRSAGHGPLVTGLLFLPIALATVAGGDIGGRLVGRLGARRLGAVGLLIAAVGLVVPVLWTTTAGMTIGLTAAAFGVCTLFVVASVTALGNVGDDEAGIASGALSTFHELGASIGVATVSSLAAASLAGGGDGGYQRAFLACAVAAAVAIAVSAAAIPARSRGAEA